MPTEPSAKPQGIPSPGAKGYESRDARAGLIFGVILFLGISGVIVHFALSGTLNFLNRKPEPKDPWNAKQPAGVAVTNWPRLQLSPRSELHAFRTREEAELNSYGWVNRSSGIARIPIETAMDRLAAKGLPVRSKPGEEKLGPSVYEFQQKRP
jgi:hypothetical protein